mmetsp:Transcript_22169/g.38328  ORF Transcript_22169/g.38328 Transcript_22169/m.38328 type:complete len:171 (-) Transcript_22169:117-629(-)
MELRQNQSTPSAFISTSYTFNPTQSITSPSVAIKTYQPSSIAVTVRVTVAASRRVNMVMPNSHQKQRQHNLKTMVRSHNVGLGAAEEFEMWVYARKQGSGVVCQAQAGSSQSGDDIQGQIMRHVEVEVIQPSCFVEQWENEQGMHSGACFDGNRPQLPSERQSEVCAWTI